MAVDDATPSAEPSAASLVGGIVEDVQTLVRQQLLLTRREFEHDVRQGAEAGKWFGIGAAALGLGAIALTAALAHLLHWSTTPAGTDPAKLPLWAAFGLVGAAFAAAGCGLLQAGKQKWASIHPLETSAAEVQNSAAEAWKASEPWKTNKPK